MQLTANFSLHELTKSETALRMGFDNTPGEAETAALRLLAEKVLQPVLVEIQILFGPRRYRFRRRAVGELLGEVFLDRHLGVQVDVRRHIGNAEATLAKHAVDPVFKQPVAVRQRNRRVFGGRRK